MYFIPPTCESIVYALEKDTGEKVWNRTVSEVKMESISHSISTPAVAYGKVFMVAIAETGESKIYVLSENDGHMIWNRSLKGLIFLSPPAIADGKVFVRGGIVLDEEGMEGMYFVFNESDGSLIWIWNSSIMNCAPCAIANEKIFITSGDGVICALGSFNIISGQLEKSSLVKMTEKRQINVGSVVTSDFYDFLAMKSIYSTSENEKIATIRYMRDIPQHYHVFSRLVVIPNIIANAEVEVNYLRR
jgi:outer membrane protein assembly factor BamB